MGKKIAVWLDREQAELFLLQGDDLQRETIVSELPGKHRGLGGQGAPHSYGTKSVTSEHNEHRWREEVLKRYFNAIATALKGAVRVVVIGPGTTKDQFFHFLQDKGFAAQLDPETQTTKHLTPAERERFVRDYFA